MFSFDVITKKKLTIDTIDKELYTQVPLLVKIYKLLINETHNLIEEKADEANEYDEDEDEDAEDDENAADDDDLEDGDDKVFNSFICL